MNCFTPDVAKEGPCGPGFIFMLLIQCGSGYCHLDLGKGYLMELRGICDRQFPQSGLCLVVVLLMTSLNLCPTQANWSTITTIHHLEFEVFPTVL